MPFIPAEDIEDDFTVEEILAKGGRSKETLKKEAAITKILTEFVQEKQGLSIDEFLKQDKSQVEKLLIDYFHHFRVTKNGEHEYPKRNTANLHKSFLKGIILKKSEGSIDISDRAVFPKFSRYFDG